LLATLGKGLRFDYHFFIARELGVLNLRCRAEVVLVLQYDIILAVLTDFIPKKAGLVPEGPKLVLIEPEVGVGNRIGVLASDGLLLIDKLPCLFGILAELSE
jgi:hypothetical protein